MRQGEQGRSDDAPCAQVPSVTLSFPALADSFQFLPALVTLANSEPHALPILGGNTLIISLTRLMAGSTHELSLSTVQMQEHDMSQVPGVAALPALARLFHAMPTFALILLLRP
jgi:hypothetical protein